MTAHNKLKTEWDTLLRLDGAQRLLCGVLTQAWFDLHSRHTDLREAVTRWMHSADFVEWCELANLHPEDVQERLRRPPPPRQVVYPNFAGNSNGSQIR
jgi:hypothetical protein